MDKVTYSKITFWKLFKLNIFSKTEIYSELSGEAGQQNIQVFVKPEYFQKEFDINKKDSGKKD